MAEYPKELSHLVPPDFCLNNYKNTAQFSSKDWFIPIIRRTEVRARLSEDDTDGARDKCNENIKLGAHESCLMEWDENSPVVVDFDMGRYNFFHQRTTGGICFAEVDLKTPNDMLVASFLAWVENKRLERGVKAQKHMISRAKSRQWHEARILQYMDVTQWQEINNLKATQGEIGLIIHPDDGRGAVAERMKVTRRHIKELNSKGYLSTLFSTPPRDPM